MEQDYLQLLLKYISLPNKEREFSIFEVSGYPHYENVCSNILAFYFNPKNPHGLVDLFLSAVLKLSGQTLNEKEVDVKISREYPTIAGGRLDLLIQSKNFTIGIENKIFHHLHNDLTDYKNTIKGLTNNNSTAILIILSLNPTPPQSDSDFINITYSDLWNEIRRNLGFYCTNPSNKWYIYLIDFINSIDYLNGENMQITERDQFFIENEDFLAKLIEDRNSFLNKINTQVSTLKNIMDEGNYSPSNLEKRWIYASSCLVHDFILSDNKIAFDLYATPKGWTLYLFGRNQKSQQFITKLIAERRDSIILKDNRFILSELKLITGLDEVKEMLESWINWVVKMAEYKRT